MTEEKRKEFKSGAWAWQEMPGGWKYPVLVIERIPWDAGRYNVMMSIDPLDPPDLDESPDYFDEDECMLYIIDEEVLSPMTEQEVRTYAPPYYKVVKGLFYCSRNSKGSYDVESLLALKNIYRLAAEAERQWALVELVEEYRRMIAREFYLEERKTKSGMIPIGTVVRSPIDNRDIGVVVDVSDNGLYTCLFRTKYEDGDTCYPVYQLSNPIIIADSYADYFDEEFREQAFRHVFLRNYLYNKALRFLTDAMPPKNKTKEADQ